MLYLVSFMISRPNSRRNVKIFLNTAIGRANRSGAGVGEVRRARVRSWRSEVPEALFASYPSVFGGRLVSTTGQMERKPQGGVDPVVAERNRQISIQRVFEGFVEVTVRAGLISLVNVFVAV